MANRFIQLYKRGKKYAMPTGIYLNADKILMVDVKYRLDSKWDKNTGERICYKITLSNAENEEEYFASEDDLF